MGPDHGGRCGADQAGAATVARQLGTQTATRASEGESSAMAHPSESVSRDAGSTRSFAEYLRRGPGGRSPTGRRCRTARGSRPTACGSFSPTSDNSPLWCRLPLNRPIPRRRRIAEPKNDQTAQVPSAVRWMSAATPSNSGIMNCWRNGAVEAGVSSSRTRADKMNRHLAIKMSWTGYRPRRRRATFGHEAERSASLDNPKHRCRLRGSGAGQRTNTLLQHEVGRGRRCRASYGAAGHEPRTKAGCCEGVGARAVIAHSNGGLHRLSRPTSLLDAHGRTTGRRFRPG